MNVRKQGETVALSYNNATLSQAFLIPIFDANGNSRPLQPWERLIVDVVSFDTESVDTANLAYLVYGSTTPTIPASGAVPTQPVIVAFTVAQGLPDQGFASNGEGVSLPVGNNLYIVYPGSAAAPVAVTGTARIINGTTQGPRAGYKEKLTAGSNDIEA